MIRRTIRQCPQFESLESMVLLSGVSVARHATVAGLIAAPDTRIGGPIVLSGTAQGTYHFGPEEGSPARPVVRVNFRAKGFVVPVGKVTLKGTMVHYLVTGGTYTLSSKHGKIFGDLITEGLSPAFYSITGGTGKWTGVSGSGEALLTTLAAKGPGLEHGKVTIQFVTPTV